MMNILKDRKNIVTLLRFLLIDTVLIGAWILYIQPTSDVTIFLIYVIPIVFFINLLPAIVFAFIKKRYAIFLLINSFIAPFLLYVFWGFYIHINKVISIDTWEFNMNNNKYTIYMPEEGTSYSITYSPEPGLSIGNENDRGTVSYRGDTIFFIAVDSTSYFIYNNHLYGFKQQHKIKIKKRY